MLAPVHRTVLPWLSASLLSAAACATLLSAAACASSQGPTETAPAPPAATATVPVAAPDPSAEATPPPPAKQPVADAAPDYRQRPQTALNGYGDRVPLHFRVDDMLEAVLEPSQRKDAEVRILAWLIQIDERPLLVEQVLLWIHIAPKNAAPTYRLANLFRHPLDRDPDRRAQWRLWLRSHSPPGMRGFPAPPSVQDLDDFTGFTDWNYDASSGFDLVNGQVCAGAWNKSFGRAPTQQFPSPK